MQTGRKTVAAVVAAATFALAPAAAQAATVTVTGDDGNPAGLTPGAPLTIRNMDFDVGVARGADAAKFRQSVTAPDGVSLINDPNYCWTLANLSTPAAYRGNGTYTVTVTEYTDTACTAVLRQTTYQYVVSAGVAIAPPAGSFLIRPKGISTPNTLELGFTGNPGAYGYDVQYARGGVIGPDGAISGPSATAIVSSTTGKIPLQLTEPGTYVMVARANGGQFNSPWSPPVTIRAQAPFDLSSRSFPDQTGPRYSVLGYVGTKGVSGRVKLAIKPRRGGRWRSLGSAKIRADGRFTKRFVVRRLGFYRLRYSFKGGALVQKGSVTEVIRVRRRII